jgi:hypothetical protein
LEALRRAEWAFTRFASHRTQAILLTGALPLIVRIALLPVLGIPEPRVHDEFGYLLIADTFASGRLTNPTHPFWKRFEEAYIFHQPTYTAKYPVAPAVLMALAKFLAAHPKVKHVLYPGLPAHPQHELAKRQQKGFGAMISFDVGSLEAARRLLENVKLCSLAESLGGVETLISHPALMTHASIPPERRREVGITDGLVRISVGIEDVEDLQADLDRALKVV